MKFLKFFLFAVITSSTIVACDKDDSPDNSKERKIMFNWRITSITIPKAGDPATDSSIQKTCTSDDIIRFTNGAFDFQDAATKCDSSIFNYAKGTWKYKINGDSIQLFATNPAKYTAWKVLTLNDSILKVRYTDSVVPANKIIKTLSFKH